jgi:two-component sensor histidine kinase
MAMARSHDLVFGAAEEAQLAVLILSQLEPFAVGARVDISGPDVRLTAQSAQYIGMAIHELATNSAKYGAWSVPDGRVTIAWSLLNGGSNTLRIAWKEHSGVTVMPRSAMGFGSTVLESVVGPALGGWSELKFEPSGVSWTCEFSGHFDEKPSAQPKVA